MGFREVLDSLDGSVRDIKPTEVIITESCRFHVRKRVTESVVRHVLQNDPRFQLIQDDFPVSSDSLSVMYDESSGRLDVYDAGQKVHTYEVLGILNHEYNIPFFGKVFPGSVKSAREEIKRGFTLMEKVFDRKDSHGIMFGHFSNYGASHIDRKKQRKLKGMDFVNPPSNESTWWSSFPPDIRELRQIYGKRLHLVNISGYMAGARDIYRELFEINR